MADARGTSAQSPALHPYTCNTCQVAYRTADLQRGHMKSDWHRYNLKRRVASLPPIAAETFTDKVLQARAASTVDADKATFEKPCDICQRTYFSENSFQNHLSSQKHRARHAILDKVPAPDEASSVMGSMPGEGAAGFDADAEEEFVQVVEGLQKTNLGERPSPVKRPRNPEPRMDQDAQSNAPSDVHNASNESVNGSETAAWTLKSCLFCNYPSPTTPLSIHHMERFHGMFIPEKPYLANLEGLLSHLQERVHNDHQCLSCGKIKSSTFAIQTHMRDSGHCMIPYTTEVEQLDIGDFYDFRSTYTDGEEESDSDDAPQGSKDDGWETDSDASSVASEDLTSVPADPKLAHFDRLGKPKHRSRDDSRHHPQADSHAHRHLHAAYYDEFELHLPFGKSVGHRSLHRYFKQNLHRHPTVEERAERLALEASRGEDAMDVDSQDPQHATRNRVRAMIPRGSLGMIGVSDHKKAVAKKSEQRGRKTEIVHNKNMEWSVNKSMNNHKSYYYRYNGGG